VIGTPRYHERVTRSTNERARALALAGAPHGTLVTADEQTAGRGRQGRRWLAQPGEALLMSLIVRGGDAAPLLPLRAAVAVRDACAALSAADCAIKWPNDVWIERRKAAGILIEGRPQDGWAVVGIGLNVLARRFPDEIADVATSLALAGAETPTVDGARGAVLAALARWLAADEPALIDAWREHDALAGERIRWSGGSGVAAGIADDGSLLVDRDDGTRVELSAGEVHLSR
jgi:BirA family transcriptional regulator, biotin operon repressor / biotin---[acetyl-CoA-carboxylase] ligase